MNRSRIELKGFFKKGAIPTEANFADLIDNVVLQREDLVVKAGNDPLTVRATGAEEAVLHFSRVDRELDQVAWQVRLKSSTGRPGLAFNEPTGPRLFLEAATGNLGVGIETPAARLHVVGNAQIAGALRVEQKNALELGFGIAKQGDAGKLGYQIWTDGLDIVGAGTAGENRRVQVFAEGGMRIRGPVGISLATNFSPTVALEVNAWTATASGWLEAIRFTRNEHSAITHPGGNLLFGLHSNRRFYFSDTSSGAAVHAVVINAQERRLGVGVESPICALDVRGVACVNNGSPSDAATIRLQPGALCIGSTNQSYGGGTNWNDNTAGLLLETQANTEIAVHDSGTRIASLMYYEGEGLNQITIGRSMHPAWGTISRVIFGGAIVPKAGNDDNSGIMFPRDPGGGGGDAAWLRYYSRGGESMTLELGISNDGDDNLILMPSGRLGIRTRDPAVTMHIVQRVAHEGIRIDETNGNGVATGRNLRIAFEGQGNIHFYQANNLGQWLDQSGNWNKNSDRALKHAIQPLGSILERVRRLRPVSFLWNETKSKDFGFIAQEVEEIFPDMVAAHEVDGTMVKGLPYDHFGVLAISALRELAEVYDQRIQALDVALRALNSTP